MKRVIQFATGLVLVMGLVAALNPASAACSAARAITSSTTSAQTFFFTPGNPFQPSGNYPITPSGGSATYYVNAIFWSFGGGNPQYNIGNDSGYFKGRTPVGPDPTWLGGGYFGGFSLFLGGALGHWAASGVDGCIDFDGSNLSQPDPNECNIVLLTDEANSVGYFAALSANPVVGNDFQYTTATGFPANITLAPVPKPIIMNSTTVGNRITITATVNPGAISPQNGFDFKCQANNIVLGYKIYVRQFPGHNTPKPVQVDTRDLSQELATPQLPAWVPVTPPAPVPFGQPSVFNLNCAAGGDTDFYLCATMLFGGVQASAAPYELKDCSMNSTKVECGPNMANPQEPTQRRIERGDSATPQKKTGTRGGR